MQVSILHIRPILMIKQAPSSQASFSLSCEARCSRPLDAHEGAAGRVCLITDPAAAHSLMKQTTSNYVSGLEMYYADDKCLCLQCTVHESDDVRAKAIRLVANKLYPLTYVAQTIEEFAVQSLLAVVDVKQSDTGQGDSMDVDSIKAIQGANGDQQSGNGLAPMDIAVVKDESQQNIGKSSPALSISDAQRYMSLFFALCTKKHALLQQLFEVYGRASKAVKQVCSFQVP
jgi:hypothetical protein